MATKTKPKTSKKSTTKRRPARKAKPNATLARVDLFPKGTTVKAYSVLDLGTEFPSGPPNVKAKATAKATADSVSFAKLNPGERYFAHAEVDGEHRYLSFTAKEA